MLNQAIAGIVLLVSPCLWLSGAILVAWLAALPHCARGRAGPQGRDPSTGALIHEPGDRMRHPSAVLYQLQPDGKTWKPIEDEDGRPFA